MGSHETIRYEMSLRIAVVGKGGSGKSLIAGTLARVLAQRGEQVLTLDSDLVPGLTFSLGLGLRAEAMLSEAAEKNEKGRWRLRRGIGPVRAIQRYSIEAPDGVRHLQCGKADGDGVAPIMGSVNAFYEVIHRLRRAERFREWAIIGDLPAGPRQVAFEWVPYARSFLLVVEPTWKSAMTARRIARIIRSRPGASVLPVASRISGPSDRTLVERMIGERTFGSVPSDPAVAAAERKGLAVLDEAPDCPAVHAIRGLADRLTDANDEEARQR